MVWAPNQDGYQQEAQALMGKKVSGNTGMGQGEVEWEEPM